jgi:hypothetical protein
MLAPAADRERWTDKEERCQKYSASDSGQYHQRFMKDHIESGAELETLLDLELENEGAPRD